jgi:YesN/AraC family two-component response regulator
LDSLALNTADELSGFIVRLKAEICQFMQTNSEEIQDGMINKIKRHIEAHYSSPWFSLQYLADQFNMTSTNMSHYFKNQTGLNISDYHNSLRISEAKRMLQEQDMTLENISQKIGYSNSSSFIRMFKQQVGCTPGEYRKIHAKSVK